MLIASRVGRLFPKLFMASSIAAALLFLNSPETGTAGQAQAQTAPASPHDIADTWQGTLHAGRDLRTVVKVTKNDKGAYEGNFYSIDQGGQPLKLDSVTVNGSDVKMELKLIGGTFTGKLSPDGKTIDGNWSQGPNPLPLVLTRATPETAWEIPKPQPPPKPMAKEVDPNFEVATIKPNNSGATSMQGLTLRGRNFETRASSLADLISFAYEAQVKQIVNAPEWYDKDRYDISAVPEQEGSPNPEQVRIMIRKLLTDRFGLKFHREKREMSAYVLSVSKDGSKLKPTQIQGTLPGIGIRPGTGGITLNVINAAIPNFTGFLQILVLDRPVVDKTGLTGRYDFQCTFAPDDSQFGGHPPQFPNQGNNGSSEAAAPSAPSLYDAFQQELGLKLSAEKTGVDAIVIDHVEKPSAN
ncbi:TIGR03435 family protein [Occallatibacter savannae]|uniref:TIGR03435 family protein n=1 Tax=Occallatibacter savannae TaxID=1002691 RepID=UPI001EF55B8B|nr:TIGR03435 family protein [Occallatibacter savannae]